MDGTGVLERELVVGFILFSGVLLAWWWMDGWMDGWGIKQMDFFLSFSTKRCMHAEKRKTRFVPDDGLFFYIFDPSLPYQGLLW
jgi:hypothetical protein